MTTPEDRAARAAYMREYTRANADKINADRRARRAANPEAFRATEKAYYDSHLEQKRASRRADYERHREVRLEYHRQYLAENREQLSAKKREYYSLNRDRWVEYREEHKEHINLATKQRRLANPEKFRAWNRADYAKHRERCLQYQREYIQRNWERHLARGHARRTKLRASGESYSPSDIQRLYETQNGACAGCRKRFCKSRPFTRDHVVPVIKGGLNSAENLQLLCKSCNSKKGSLLPDEWAERIGKLFV